MEELTQTIIEIPKFTLFIPTRERPYILGAKAVWDFLRACN